MAKAISLHAMKTLVEKKMKKKILLKMMWNDNEKLTLFIIPNMKINSFIFDEKEGYLFYDLDGKPVTYDIPCILTEADLEDGKVKLEALQRKKVLVNNEPLSSEDIALLEEL
ncbi:hypothetical protein SAMN05216389_1125 [Oceanobacillus limi]|uniref:Uncharacterized protein n=1 Tax=Oceanobacillus limi TaxID=930131 RepID=A0A1I0EQ27_9BACI|nr:hypothetical protein [Oceanobacillus limi]SET46718.1 hypothetical protein SAMN05216389_1125 [Oceanobacillus limi]